MRRSCVGLLGNCLWVRVRVTAVGMFGIFRASGVRNERAVQYVVALCAHTYQLPMRNCVQLSLYTI